MSKIFKYLLLGFSLVFLLIFSNEIILGDFTQRGPDIVLADDDNCEANDNCSNPGTADAPVSPTIPPVAPPAPAPVPASCTANFQYNQCVACNESEPVYTDSCSGAFSTGPRQADAACASWCPAPGPQCTPNEVVGQGTRCVGPQMCTYNIHQREDCSRYDGGNYGCQNDARCGFAPPPPPPPICQSDGSCNATPACGQTANGVDNCGRSCTRTGPACAAQVCVPNGSCNAPFPACGQLTQGVDNCGNFCQRSGQACVPGACIATSCNAPFPACGQTSTGVDNCNNSCFRRGPVCPVTPPPAVPPPAAPITITNTHPQTQTVNAAPISITNSNPTTVTVSVPQGQAAGATREVVREVQTSGNVGVAASTTQIAAVKQLPSTGLPALAWAALAFIPAGFRIRRFSKVKEETSAKPHYLWEDRQFKV